MESIDRHPQCSAICGESAEELDGFRQNEKGSGFKRSALAGVFDPDSYENAGNQGDIGHFGSLEHIIHMFPSAAVDGLKALRSNVSEMVRQKMQKLSKIKLGSCNLDF